jgi:hypothetical protein
MSYSIIMEDTIVLKQHYIYMFRLDLGYEIIDVKPKLINPLGFETVNPTQKLINTPDKLIKSFEKYNVANWVGKIEVGKETEKLHYQMAIWFEHKQTKNEINAFRKYWSDRLGSHTCAIKSGRKIRSLVSYSTKEHGKLITNLPAIVLARIPKWKNKTAEAVCWNDKIEEYIEDNDLKNSGREAFAYKLLEFYKLHNKRPTRTNIQFLLWRYEKINSFQLLIDWRLIDDGYGQDTISNL